MKTSICRLKFRRGKEENRKDITPEQGEPVFSTDVGRLAIGDGETKGGIPINKTWTREPELTAVAPGDIKIIDGSKISVYGGNSWIQTGGSGLVKATAPLEVIGTNNVKLNIGSDSGINSKYVSLGTVNGNLTVTDTNNLISMAQNVSLNSNSIETLSANRIYKSVQPLAIAYSAIYDKSMEEVSSIMLPDEITDESGLSGTIDGRTYSINRGIKLLYTDNLTTVLSAVSFYEYDSSNTLVKVTSSLPHLDVNLDKIQETATAAATTAAITNVNNKVDTKINIAIPTGVVLPFAGNTIPDGYLCCNGAEVSRTTYAKLFAAIGTTYGSGKDSTTFKLPDLKGRFIEGADNSDVGTIIEAGLPNITGSWSPGYGGQTGNSDGTINGCVENETVSILGNNYPYKQLPMSGFNIDASRSSKIYGNSTTVQPPAVKMIYCIKYN